MMIIYVFNDKSNVNNDNERISSNNDSNKNNDPL